MRSAFSILLLILIIVISGCTQSDNLLSENNCAKEGQTAKAYEELTCCVDIGYFQNYLFDASGNCNKISESFDNHHICIKCGDNNCGVGENRCNCPQDCDPAGCVTEGDTMFPNDGNKCCAGLNPEWNYEINDDKECESIQGENGHQLICVKCRNGICGTGENGCNCPQDCKDFKCKGHGEIPLYTSPYDDMSIQCCDGLLHGVQKDAYDDDCVNLFEKHGGAGYFGICLSCGDGVCDEEVESKCNCPEDCE
jgi:hypothetical protein